MPPRRKRSEPEAPERVGALIGAEDRRQAIETFGRAFADPAWMETHVADALFRGPAFDPEHTRVAVADGRVVAGVVMGPRRVRFGSVAVPAMTVGPVGTHDRYRKRGYAAAAMHDASRYMSENGILVAYLQGIPDFYHRFGYYPYMAPGAVRFKRAGAEKECLPGRLLVMRSKHMPAVRRIYEQAASRHTLSAVRGDDVWKWLTGPARKTWMFRNPRVIVDEGGRVRGYTTVRREGEGAQGEFLVGQDDRSCRVALGALVKDARKREEKDLVLPLPWDDALAVFLRQHVEAQWRTWSYPTGGALMKVVDFPELMRRLEATLSERRRAAGSSVRKGALTLETDLGAVGVSVRARSVKVGEPLSKRVVKVPQRWLSGLLTGYYGVEDVSARKDAHVPRELVPAVEALFPRGWPYAYQGDNY